MNKCILRISQREVKQYAAAGLMPWKQLELKHSRQFWAVAQRRQLTMQEKTHIQICDTLKWINEMKLTNKKR